MENKLLRTDDYISGLVEKYSDMVLRIGLTYLKNMADAEDICQNVFIKLYSLNKVFNDEEHEKAWIIRMTINACKDVLKSSLKKRFFPVQDVPLPIKNPESRTIVSHVLELPLKYRSVIYLHYFENYSTAEIANMSGKKDATIRTQLKRARELLRTKMIGGFDSEEKIY